MDEEQLWRDAKSFARRNNRSMDWAYIIDIYTALGGYKTRVFFQNEPRVNYRLLGTYTDFQDLVITDKGLPTLIPHEEVMTKRKNIDKEGTDKDYYEYDRSDLLEEPIGNIISKGYKNDVIKVYK